MIYVPGGEKDLGKPSTKVFSLVGRIHVKAYKSWELFCKTAYNCKSKTPPLVSVVGICV